MKRILLLVVLTNASLFCMEKQILDNESSQEKVITLPYKKRKELESSSSEDKQKSVEPQKGTTTKTPLLEKIVIELLAPEEEVAKKAKITSRLKILNSQSKQEILSKLLTQTKEAHTQRLALERKDTETEIHLKKEESAIASLQAEHLQLKNAVHLLAAQLKKEETRQSPPPPASAATEIEKSLREQIKVLEVKYKSLSEVHEKLFEEHQKSLEQKKRQYKKGNQ